MSETSPEFPPNRKSSEKATPAPEPKAAPKKLESVVTGEVVQRKKPLGSKMRDTFLSETAKGTGAYLVRDVLVPAAKNLVTDMITQGLDRILYGDSRPRPRPGGGPAGHVSYNRMGRPGSSTRNDPPWSTSTSRDTRVISSQARATHDFNEIILATRDEADAVITALMAQMEAYDVASVSDLYSLVGITGSYTDDNWGWNDLRDAGVRRVREGYLLELPRTVELK